MKKPGFPPSTIALVVLLFGALYMVSKTVTPPPALPPPVTPASATAAAAPPATDPGHGEPGHEHGKGEDTKASDAPAAPDSKQMQKMYQEKMEIEKKKHEEEVKRQAEVQRRINLPKLNTTKPLKYDPSTTNIDSKFFTEMPMGESGIKATDEAVAQADAIKAKMRQAQPTKPTSDGAGKLKQVP